MQNQEAAADTHAKKTLKPGDGEHVRMETEKQIDLSPSGTDFVVGGRSAPSIAQLSLAKVPATVCSACGRSGEPFHRLKHDGAARYFCTSCILFLYKGMYCCLCFLVYETPAAKGDSALWVSCAKCQRIGHVTCARHQDLHIDSVFFTCPKCCQPEKPPVQSRCASTEGEPENGGPPFKRLRFSGDEQSARTPSAFVEQSVHAPPDEALAAAQIVALLAVQQAKDAKARARASAAAAARAAACAKAALDTAYRVSQEEARWKPESSRRFSGVLPGNNGGLPNNALKNLKVDGGVLTPSPLSYSIPPAHKDQVGKGYTSSGYVPLNTRVTEQYNKMKASSPIVEVPGAVLRRSTSQKPQAVCVQEAVEGVHNVGTGVESEVVNVRSSPASILDAAASLDTPQINSSVEPGSGHCSVPEAAFNASSSAMAFTRNGLSGNGAPLQTSKDQSLPFDKKDLVFDDSAETAAREVAHSKSSTVHGCKIDVEGMQVSPHLSGIEKPAGDG